MLKAALVIGFIVVISGFAGGTIFVATAVLGALLLAGIGGWQQTAVCIPEMEVGVVYSRGGQKFCRFLPAGNHFIKPFSEQLGASIPRNPGSVDGRCQNVQTIGGLPLTVEWTISYSLNPQRILIDKRPKLARSLPHKSSKIVTTHANNILRHIMSEFSIEQLTQPGIQKKLERQTRQQMAERLANAGFEFSRVMIGSIEMPTQVATALAAALQRQLEAENEARALAKLQQVVSQYSEADMQRLIELERIHTMGQNGVTLMYSPPAEVIMNGKRAYKTID